MNMKGVAYEGCDLMNSQDIYKDSYRGCYQHDVSIHFKALIQNPPNCLVKQDASQYPYYHHRHECPQYLWEEKKSHDEEEKVT